MKYLFAILLAAILVSSMEAAVAVRFSYTGPDVANQPALKLSFQISDTGVISMDASTKRRNPEVIAAVDAWDNEDMGAVEDKALFGKSFSLTAFAENEQGPGFPPVALWADDGGVLGVGGHNARRIDGQVVKNGRNLERLIWTLEGDVALHLLNFACGSGVHNGGIILESPDREMRTGPMGKNKTANWNIPAGAVSISGGQKLIFKADPDLKNGAGLVGLAFEVTAGQ
jgi:hypothetical protein